MSSETKQALRQEYRARRNALTKAQYRTKSAAVRARLQALPEYHQAAAVLTYVAAKDNEVDTCPLIRDLLNEGRTVLVPVAESDRSMPWSRLEVFKDLAPARFGILEPKPGRRCLMDPPQGSIVLVPGLAFTPQGERVGYGGGYFDRFLAAFPGISIGLAFDCQIADNLPREPHDVCVDIVLTESSTFYAKE